MSLDIERLQARTNAGVDNRDAVLVGDRSGKLPHMFEISIDAVVTKRAASHLRRFRRAVDTALPGKIARLILFGSRARGDARRDSDYDVAVFVEQLDDRRAIDGVLTDAAYPHILAGYHIRPIAVPADFLESLPKKPLAIDIARDGLVVT